MCLMMGTTCQHRSAGVRVQILETEWFARTWWSNGPTVHRPWPLIPILVTTMTERSLSFVRVTKDLHNLLVVAEVDGPVRSAILWPFYGRPPGQLGCWLEATSFGEGMRLYTATGLDALGSLTRDEGLLGGPIDDLTPQLLHRHVPENIPMIGWLAEIGFQLTYPFDVLAWPWTMDYSTLVQSPADDPEGLRASQLVARHNVLFFSTVSLVRAGIKYGIRCTERGHSVAGRETAPVARRTSAPMGSISCGPKPPEKRPTPRCGQILP